VRIAARTSLGIVAVDLESGEAELLEEGFELPLRPPVDVDLPLLVDAASAGSTVVAVVDRRPPLVVSHDAGRTWTETGGGLPGGRAVAVSEDDPDLVVYAARNRIYVSRDGGRFWQSLAAELPEIEAIGLLGF
jgi:hypothetical protein